MAVRRLGLATAVVLASVVAPAPVAAVGSASSGLTLVSTVQLSARLQEVAVRSEALGAVTRFRVLLPAGYATGGRRYPVLYLLHGAGDDQTSWSEKTDVEALTAPRDLIVVMPDAGKNANAGWYSDWFNAGAFGPPAWERYHVGELIPFVDAHYRTDARRQARAVAGLSMGGFGSFSYAARHPDLFVAAASFSGALDTTSAGPAEAEGLKAFHDRFGTPDDRVWGTYESEEVRWRDHCPVDLAENLRDIDLYMTTGNGTPDATHSYPPQDGPVESAVFAMNTTMDVTLTRDGIAHTYVPYGAGGHDWYYWQRDLHQWLPRLLSVLAAPPPAPATFHYRSAEPRFSVYGWNVSVDRSVQEFLTLDAVSAAGLTVTGSGTAHVWTPPAYRAGARYQVGKAVVAADDAGRLTFDVDLGPSHQLQQYTPQERLAEAAQGASYFRTVRVPIAPVVVSELGSGAGPGTSAGPTGDGGRRGGLAATGAREPWATVGLLLLVVAWFGRRRLSRR